MGEGNICWTISTAYKRRKRKDKRVPGKPNTLVGTGGYRKFVEKMTPGSSYGKDFINKYKAKK